MALTPISDPTLALLEEPMGWSFREVPIRTPLAASKPKVVEICRFCFSEQMLPFRNEKQNIKEKEGELWIAG
jgi:hypothetical protein